MRWFSHRRRTGGRKAPEDRDAEYRSRKPPSACTAVTLSPQVAATQWYRLPLCAAYGVRRMPYYALSMGMTQQFFVFLSSVTLTFDFDLDARTRAKFLYSALNRQVSSFYV